MNKGEIWLANLNPNKGAEPGKLRPVLIIQNQTLLNIKHPTTIIIPLTSHIIEEAEPLRLHVSARDQLKKDSDLLIDQIRAIDNKRFAHGPICRLEPGILNRIYTCIDEVIGQSHSN